MEQNNVTRRGFLDRLLALGGIALVSAVVYPIIKYLIPPKSGEAAASQVKLPFTRADLQADPRKSRTFRFGRQLGIIVLDPNGQLHAVSATCTHLDCTVQYKMDEGLLWCACHNGRYQLNGANISGPPPRPLEKYVVNEAGAELFVSKETA